MKSLADLAQDRGGDFTMWAKSLLRGAGGANDALHIAQVEHASPRVKAIMKAQAEGVLLPDSRLGDLNIVSAGFLAALRNQGAFDAMLGSMVRVPLQTPGVRVSSTALIGSSAAEGEARPISWVNFQGAALTRRRSDAIVVISDQLAEAMTAPAQAMLSRELRAGVVGATDLPFLAGLAEDISALPSSGGDAADVLADLEDMLAALGTTAGSKLFLILSPAVAKRLSVKPTTTGARAFPEMSPTGGSIAGITVLVSDHLPAGGSPATPAIMLIDATGIAADSDVVTLDTATHASVEMVNPPTMTVGGTGSPSAPVAAEMVNLWQVNCRGLRASRYYGFLRMRDDAVAVLDGGGW